MPETSVNIYRPKTLEQAIRYFSDPDVAHDEITKRFFPNGVLCPHCSGTDHYFIKTRRIWRCKGCEKQFSVRVGTILEDSPVGLDKWLVCMWMVFNTRGIDERLTSIAVSNALGIRQPTAWFMIQRIQLALDAKTLPKPHPPEWLVRKNEESRDFDIVLKSDKRNASKELKAEAAEIIAKYTRERTEGLEQSGLLSAGKCISEFG